ncbi:MAP microtubule affinity-regulating kinase 1 [Rhizoclosmatium sp. JEL0117]|nr:MAP microtubule affinity-regulating kinase 1 [Rhizoclosmatium sp. JEL0117]
MSTTSGPNPPESSESTDELYLERYRVTKVLGEGSYGRVKLAVDLENNRKVALKIINKTSIKKPEHVTRIKREVRILRLLNHPNIVKLHDVAETDKEIILSMEYIEGGELFDFIVANPRLNEKIARRIFRQIISAVDYCHQSSVIHRDLKPENLLLDNDKNIKIIDFGFVNLYDPEDMILGKKYIGPEIDIWSMGVILFALLAGKLPFRDSNVKELYRKITSSSFDLPSCIGKESGDLIKIMLKANPMERATLEQVRQHEWINIGYDKPPDSFVPPRPPATEPLSKTTLNTMRLYGFDDDTVKKAILSSTTHPAFLLYSLIKEHDAAEAVLAAQKAASKQLEPPESQANSHSLTVPGRHNSVRRRKSIAAIGSNAPSPAINHQSTLGVGLKTDGARSEGGSFEAMKPDTMAKTSLKPTVVTTGVSTETLGSKVAASRTRKSTSNAPTTVMLKNSLDTRVTEPVPIVSPVLQLPGLDDPKSPEGIDSGKQLNLPLGEPKKRQRSFSFRYPSKAEKDKLTSSTVDEMKLSNQKIISPPGSLVIDQTISLTAHDARDVTSPSGTLKPSATPQRRLSITSKIGNALSKIINIPRSRRGSTSPEGSMLLSVPRVSKNMYGVDTTSSKKPEEIMKELNRVFELNGITPTWTGFKVNCVAPNVVFDIEICSIRKTAMHGLELRRKKGSVWTYQSVCGSVISQLKL